MFLSIQYNPEYQGYHLLRLWAMTTLKANQGPPYNSVWSLPGSIQYYFIRKKLFSPHGSPLNIWARGNRLTYFISGGINCRNKLDSKTFEWQWKIGKFTFFLLKTFLSSKCTCAHSEARTPFICTAFCWPN